MKERNNNIFIVILTLKNNLRSRKENAYANHINTQHYNGRSLFTTLKRYTKN